MCLGLCRAAGELGLQAAVLCSQRGSGERRGQGLGEQRQVAIVLDDIVDCSRLHRRHRGALIAAPGHHQRGDLQPHELPEHRQSVHVGKRVVQDGGVVLAAARCLEPLAATMDGHKPNMRSIALEVAQRQHGVVRLVLDQEDAQWHWSWMTLFHGHASQPSGGGSTVAIQNSPICCTAWTNCSNSTGFTT